MMLAICRQGGLFTTGLSHGRLKYGESLNGEGDAVEISSRASTSKKILLIYFVLVSISYRFSSYELLTIRMFAFFQLVGDI